MYLKSPLIDMPLYIDKRTWVPAGNGHQSSGGDIVNVYLGISLMDPESMAVTMSLL